VRPPAFSPGQVVGAVALAGLVQASVGIAIWLTKGTEKVQRELPTRELRIAVKPMLDAPLPKQGVSKPVPNKLPDMWKPPDPAVIKPKPAPTPAPEAKKPIERDDHQVTKPDDKKEPKERPEPETPQAKRVDDLAEKMRREAQEASSSEEGLEDGVKEGTEKDPLKARAVDSYRAKLIAWFQQGFVPPIDELGCEELVKLSANVTARIDANREVTGYSLEPSGNTLFDEKVRMAMELKVGQTVPPPPPNYPDLIGSKVLTQFQGKNEKCN
jgi:hypothetical protein